jgi:cytochrome c biogenesis protein CcmG, thiol:disulfide interchange protein DsbE
VRPPLRVTVVTMSTDVEPVRRRRSSMRTVLVGAGIVALVLVGVAVAATRGNDAMVTGSGDLPRLDERPSPDEVFALPPATLAGFADGPDVNLADFRGQPLIVNFWATWCAPCVKEMPDLQEVATQAEGQVAFLGIDVEDAPPNAEPFVAELGITYPLALDPRREYSRQVNNFGMPTTLFVDPDGLVQYRHTGPLDADQLRALIAEHLAVDL